MVARARSPASTIFMPPMAEFMRPATSLRPAFRYLRHMGRLARSCFEDREGDSWVCIRATTVMGPAGPIPVQKGRSFTPKTVFADIDDFTSYLANVSVACAPSAPHGN